MSVSVGQSFRAVLWVGLLAAASQAHAQSTRTWISGTGDDVNPCSRAAPCKTFAGAISKTQTGGEIDTLDPGGFGAVTVTKSITLASDGAGTAGILAVGTSEASAGPRIASTQFDATEDPEHGFLRRGFQDGTFCKILGLWITCGDCRQEIG